MTSPPGAFDAYLAEFSAPVPSAQRKRRRYAAAAAELRGAREIAARKSPFGSWKELCLYYGNRCVCCGQRATLTKDHVIPRSRGGPDNLANLQPLCRACNQAKGDRVADYRRRGPYTPVVQALIPDVRREQGGGVMDVAAVIEGITYKPGWRLSVTRRQDYLFGGSPGVNLLRITAEVPDARHPGRTTTVTADNFIPEYVDSEEHLLRWVRHALTQVELHERDEFFRYQGDLVNDPHGGG
jgi:5-methylcytosine-specific restriction endonuclease McrA